MKLHRIFFYLYMFLIPVQTRILYLPDKAYINWYFAYNLAFFLYFTDIVLFLCFTAWLLFDPLKLEHFPKKSLLLVCLGFILWTLLSLLHVKHIDFGLYSMVKWAELILLLLYIVWNTKTEMDYLVASAILFVSSIFQGGLAWFQFHMQHSMGLNFLGEYVAPMDTAGLATIDTVAGKIIRGYGTFPHPNVLGAFLVLGTICGLIIVSYETNSNYRTAIRLGGSLGLFLAAMGLFVSFSRIAWLGAAFSVLGFSCYNLRLKHNQALLCILIPVIVSCATIVGVYRTDLKARISDTNPTSLSDRYFFNGLGIKLIERQPLVGVGVGNYVSSLTELYQLDAWQYQPAHNIFIFITAELGLVGLLLFLWLLFEIFSKIKDTEWGPIAVGWTMAGGLFLLMGQFDHYFVTIQQGRLMFFTVLGLIAALPNLTLHEKTP